MSAHRDKNSPDISKIIMNWIWRKVGMCGLYAIFLLGVLWTIWSQRDNVLSLPVVRNVVKSFSQEPIPRADPKRFSIAVVHLEGDDSLLNSERLIIEAMNEVGGIQVLEIDRKINVRARPREDAVKEGHGQAQEYLRESGADVLIWGTVLSAGGQTVLKLYWTISADQFAKWQRYQPTGNLSLPQ
ncbi:MAG: hypothetical protein ABIP88_14925, partial [Candidatus Binatia bacterium]